MKTPVLETERLLLRTFTKEDVTEVFDCWMRDRDVSRYMMWESSEDIKEAEEFIEYELSMILDDNWYRWCIVDKKTNVIVGTCLIFYNEDEGCWDISYNLGKKYWGNGYSTEAMKKAMDFVIHTVGAKEFVACHAVENKASGKVIEKLGFQFEENVEYVCDGGRIHTVGKKYRLK